MFPVQQTGRDLHFRLAVASRMQFPNVGLVLAMCICTIHYALTGPAKASRPYCINAQGYVSTQCQHPAVPGRTMPPPD